jgi:hypothetical protein
LKLLEGLDVHSSWFFEQIRGTTSLDLGDHEPSGLRIRRRVNSERHPMKDRREQSKEKAFTESAQRRRLHIARAEYIVRRMAAIALIRISGAAQRIPILADAPTAKTFTSTQPNDAIEI